MESASEMPLLSQCQDGKVDEMLSEVLQQPTSLIRKCQWFNCPYVQHVSLKHFRSYAL
jgi:hypothetical protein